MVGELEPAHGESVQQIKQVADSPLMILVEGETGTGKELVARAIHHVLQVARGNKSEAARLLRTDYKTLHLKMKQYGRVFLRKREPRSGPGIARSQPSHGVLAAATLCLIGAQAGQRPG